MSDTVSLEGLFKSNYDSSSKIFAEQQNLAAPSWKKPSVSPQKPSAIGFVTVVTMSGNELGGAMNETESFQTPESLNPVQATITIREINWPFTVTGRAIALSQNDQQAFASSLDAQMKDNMNRMMSDINRQFLGKGTGQMSLANGAGVATTTLVVDNALPFRRGMRIDSYLILAGAKEINGAYITAVNYATNTLTLNANQTWSDNSIIVKYNINSGAPVGGKEITGLQAMCDTTAFSSTYEGISVAANPEWVGNVVDAGVAPVSQDLLQQTWNRTYTIGGGRPNYMISNVGQARTFLNTELQKTRYAPEEVKAGHTVLKWNELEWLIDKDYDIKEVGMYDMNYIQKFQAAEPAISRISGNDVYQITGSNQIGGYYTYYGNVGTHKRNAHARLTNLTEPTF